jgi:hypothetical protein
MKMEKGEEINHIIEVIEKSKTALKEEKALELKELSNQIIHSTSIYQTEGLIAISVILYSLGKLIERKEHLSLKDWNAFIEKTNKSLDEAIDSLKDNNEKKFERILIEIRSSIGKVTVKPFVHEVLRKAAINKASRLYEHGLSLEQTAKLLGISQWELSEYTGQTGIPDVKYASTLDIKKRAKTALDFFGGEK